MKIKDDFTIKILLVLFLAFVVRIAYVDTLPAALFGDIIEHLRMAKSASIVRWGGDGALFPLLTSITTRIGGLSFLTLKVTSVIISLFGVLATILYAKALTKNRTVAVFAGLFMAIGYWDINMSHSGKPYALVPLFAALIPYLLLQKKYVRAGVALGLSLYSQAAAWGLFALSLVNPITFISALITGSVFFKEMILTPDNFFSSGSHIGEKLAVSKIEDQGILDAAMIVVKNIYLQIQALFIHGDPGFRGMLPTRPHIDEVTAFFLLAGLIFALYKIKSATFKKPLLYFVIPFFLVQLPAALDINNPLSAPSFGRTLGMYPYICVAAAYGLHTSLEYIKKNLHLHDLVIKTALIMVFCIIGTLNLYRYWFLHPTFLPNHNVPFAEIIAQKAATISPSIPTFTYNCCWGQWGQPEPGAFEFLARSETMYPPLTKENLCFRLQGRGKNAVIFSDPNEAELPQILSQCGWKVTKDEVIYEHNETVGRMYSISFFQ